MPTKRSVDIEQAVRCIYTPTRESIYTHERVCVHPRERGGGGASEVHQPRDPTAPNPRAEGGSMIN